MKTLFFIYAGVGGVDAQDWAEMLLRMYERFFTKKGWNFKRLDIVYGKEAGIKNAILEIAMDYDKLKNEAGVHRLVRLSPFSAKKLRHTSFALLEVLPAVREQGLNLSPSSLRFDTFRASGPGGQHVNKTDSAVRVTHISSGLAAASQSERSQAQNKAKALAILRAKLLELERKRVENEQASLKTGLSAAWGNQTRSYILHPYKLARDEKTGKKYHNPEAILAGDLDKFIRVKKVAPHNDKI